MSRLRSIFFSSICVLALIASGPLRAQIDSRWGILAELAEHDFRSEEFKVTTTFRWKVENRILQEVQWAGGGRRNIEYELDIATGQIEKRYYGQMFNNAERQTGFSAAPDGTIIQKGKAQIERAPGGGYKFGDRLTYLPVPSSGPVTERLAQLIREGKLRAANPNRTDASVVAGTAAVSEPSPSFSVAETGRIDPRWGALAELANHDFIAENGLPYAFRWRTQDRILSSFNLYYGKVLRTDYELNPATGEITENYYENSDHVRQSIRRNRAQPDGSYKSYAGASVRKFAEGNFKYGQRRLRMIGPNEVTPPILAELLTDKSLRSTGAQMIAENLRPPPTLSTGAAGADVVSNFSVQISSSLPHGPRLALVIGNSAYEAGMGNLPNPANDAGAMASALGSLGFQVTLIRNASQKVMKQAISDFGERLTKSGPGSTALFFYAGHGIQAKGINYLIPTDANIQTIADVDRESVGADAVLEQMEEAGSATNIVILDACRNMPLVRGFRSATNGLAPMDAPNGSFIAYSTAPGSVAADGMGANSPFVTALIKNMGRKGESIESIFRNVRREVRAATENEQTPWDSSSLVEPFYFASN